MNPTDPLVLAAFVVGAIATARATRLLVHDKWPPVVAARVWFVNHVLLRLRGDWTELVECVFCVAPYVAAGNLAWAVLARVDPSTGWGAAWWITNTWAAVAYVAAMIVTRDTPPPVVLEEGDEIDE